VYEEVFYRTLKI